MSASILTIDYKAHMQGLSLFHTHTKMDMNMEVVGSDLIKVIEKIV